MKPSILILNTQRNVGQMEYWKNEVLNKRNGEEMQISINGVLEKWSVG